MINLADIKDSKDPNLKFDNRYRLIEKIGGGGFSEVWLAHDTNADIDVALKIYTPNGELDDEGKEDFKKEFARLCGLNHSNIIHAIGFGIHDDELPYLAMSVCKNGSAKKLIGNFDEEQLWDFIEQVASGLQYLHTHDITHQDIKPDNILINSDGQYLIIDFGISTRTRNTLRKSVKGSVGGGTTWYMSNESFGTESSDIHARDIWAFGATLYEIVTGDTPFGQYGGVSQKAQNGKIPPIKKDVSEELKRLIYDCLAFDAWNRPDASEIVERARRHKNGLASTPRAKRPFKKIIAGVASVSLLVVCGYYFLSQPVDPDPPIPPIPPAPVINKNDDIYLSKVEEAVTIATEEINKKNMASVDEKRLCSAAEIVSEAKRLEVTDSVKSKGIKMWAASQKMIDSTYEYLYNKGVEYGKAQADIASKEFKNRCSVLINYVTPSKVKQEVPTKKTKPKKRVKEERVISSGHDNTQITPSSETQCPRRPYSLRRYDNVPCGTPAPSGPPTFGLG